MRLTLALSSAAVADLVSLTHAYDLSLEEIVSTGPDIAAGIAKIIGKSNSYMAILVENGTGQMAYRLAIPTMEEYRRTPKNVAVIGNLDDVGGVIADALIELGFDDHAFDEAASVLSASVKEAIGYGIQTYLLLLKAAMLKPGKVGVVSETDNAFYPVSFK